MKDPNGQEAEKPETEDSKEQWVEVKVSLLFGYDDNVVLLNEDRDIVDDYSTSKFVCTLDVRVTPVIRDKWKLGFQYDLYASLHDEVEYRELQAHSLVLFAFWRSSPNYFYIPVTANVYFLDGDTYMNSVKLVPAYYREQGKRMLLSVSAGVELLNYMFDSDQGYDGTDYQAFISETYMFDSDTWIKGTVGFNKVDADEESRSYMGPKFIVSGNMQLFWDIDLALAYSFQYRDYDEYDEAWESERLDRRHVLSAELKKEFSHGISAVLSYTMVVNDSNTERYDYHRNIIMAGIEWSY
ncbi:MAG: DUF2860 family protein [Planctomycetota bacterium]|nr:DUF2860 family protein [Planctomycetota bacterium]